MSAFFARLRARHPFLDHLVRTYGRYQGEAGDRLAAAVTFYWFLSLFPLLLLAVSVMGYVLGGNASAAVSHALRGYLPADVVTTIGTTLETAKGRAGLLGAAGLLLAGLGWIDALRDAIRTMWHHNLTAGNLVTRKLGDIVALVGLFATVTASIVVTAATTTATGEVLHLLGVAQTAAASALTQALTYLLACAADTLLFLYLFLRLPKLHFPLRRVLKGAFLGAVGFQGLKYLGAYYVKHTTSTGKATYGTFAVVVGLLLFLNLVSRYLLLVSAFVVTAPYDSDVAPSGTADPALAKAAGIPTEYAEESVEGDPPASVKGGAPTPLGPALRR